MNKFIKEAFKTPIGNISEPFSNVKGMFLIVDLEERQPRVPGFDEVKDMVKDDYVAQEKDTLCLLAASELIKKLSQDFKEDTNLFKDFIITEAFSRTDPVESIDSFYQLKKEAFNLEVEQFGNPIPSKKGYIIYQVIEKITKKNGVVTGVSNPNQQARQDIISGALGSL